VIPDATTQTTTFVPNDNGTYKFSLTVNDLDTGTNTSNVTITVNNVKPSLTLNSVPPINENDFATLTGTFTDPGTADSHTLTVAGTAWTLGSIATCGLGATSGRAVGNTFNSSTDGTVRPLTAVNTTTGVVSFSTKRQYLNDGPAPGNGTASDTISISVTV